MSGALGHDSALQGFDRDNMVYLPTIILSEIAQSENMSNEWCFRPLICMIHF